jgi:hypothetical protein
MSYFLYFNRFFNILKLSGFKKQAKISFYYVVIQLLRILYCLLFFVNSIDHYSKDLHNHTF